MNDSNETENDQNDILTLLQTPRSTPAKALNVYCIHAIGGTFYPYYLIMQAFPENCRIYGIKYNENYNCETLLELAEFYAKKVNQKYFLKILFPYFQILDNQKTSLNQHFLLAGHSLGGILSREIAFLVNKWKNDLTFVPFVIAFDSWALGTENLNLDVVNEYLKVFFCFNKTI